MTTPLKRKAADLAASSIKKPKANASITSFFAAPASSTTTSASASATATANSDTSSAAPKFDKEKWVAKLSAEQSELLEMEIKYLHASWLAQLKDEIVSPDFMALKRFLRAEKEQGKTIFPPEREIYSWSEHTPLNTVKAVIIGQDPYHNVNQAHGLCFSVKEPCPAPPSLKNMYIALKKDYPDFLPPPKMGGLLTPWARQGILLLNTVLTVRAHEANSHAQKGWEKFTQKVIDVVAKQRTKGVVFLVWGTPAKTRVRSVDRKKHCVLESVHPSPLSASRGFFDCGHFKKTNEWLKQRYGDDGEIDWNLNVSPPVLASAANVIE